MPKIAIDISPLNNGNAVRGVGYYTKNLVDALQTEIASNPDYKNWSISLLSSLSSLCSGFDLIHYPFFDPFKLTLPQKSLTPFIVTVHDLIPLQFPKHYPPGLKGRFKWLMQRHRLMQAQYIITDSNFSKYIIKDIVHYPVDRIFVTYLAAVNHPPVSKKQLLTVKNKYHLPEKFVLYVGDINWNKNIPTLVTACLDLKIPLVIVGASAVAKNVPRHPETQDLLWLQSKALEHQRTSALTLTGFVPDDDLNAIFNLATLYCQPSLAEGFGLPVVQAMKLGRPVVYSQETSLPEIMDYNGEMFDPYSPDSLKKALIKVWRDVDLQKKYSQDGLSRSKIFDWSFTARQTLAVYQLALTGDK